MIVVGMLGLNPYMILFGSNTFSEVFFMCWLLGVFLLGVLTQKANQRGAMVGMLFGFSTELYLWRAHVPWTWWVVIGTTVTFAVGYIASLFQPVQPKQPDTASDVY